MKSEIDSCYGNSNELWKVLKNFMPSKAAANYIPKNDEDMSAVDLANEFNSVFCTIGSDLADKIPDPPVNYRPPPIIGGIHPLFLLSPEYQYIVDSIQALAILCVFKY